MTSGGYLSQVRQRSPKHIGQLIKGNNDWDSGRKLEAITQP